MFSVSKIFSPVSDRTLLKYHRSYEPNYWNTIGAELDRCRRREGGVRIIFLEPSHFWSQLYQTYGGMLSAETAMENSGIENPQEELLKASVNTLFMSPEAQQVRTMMMLKGLQGQAAEVLRAFQSNMLQNSQPVQPPQGMMPPPAGMQETVTDQFSVGEEVTPSGIEENVQMDRQVNVANEMF